MDKLIEQEISKLVNNSDFITRNNIDINRELINIEYLYTCISNSEYQKIVDSIYNLSINNGKMITKNMISYRVNKILLEYCQKHFGLMEKSITTLNEHPFWEQKSELWLSQRKTMLTGTDAGKVVNTGSDDNREEKLFNIAKDKLDYKEILQVPNIYHSRISSTAMRHGNIYEDVSLLIYETRLNVKVSEYGLIKSYKLNFIGASPDGVVTNVDYTDYNSFRRYGRLVEVKNPFSRIINDTIKEDYRFQMLQQQYTCEIPVCDFLETTIIDMDCPIKGMKPYNNIKSMLNDVLDTDDPEWESKIQNHNIPFTNLNSEGKEKGVLLSFTKNEDRKTFIYPITEEYTVKSILTWKKETIAKMSSEGFNDYVFKVWKLEVFDVKQFVFNGKEYISEDIPILDSSWKLISQFKQKLIDIIRKKQKFLSIPDIYDYMRGLTYSKYLTLVNDANFGQHIDQIIDSNIGNNRDDSNNSGKSSNNNESNIDISKYL